MITTLFFMVCAGVSTLCLLSGAVRTPLDRTLHSKTSDLQALINDTKEAYKEGMSPAEEENPRRTSES